MGKRKSAARVEIRRSVQCKEQTHPCLIEYEALSETEKDIDRATVEQTIKMLLYMGYKIERAKET